MTELTPKFMDISSVYSGDELGLPYRDILGEGIVGAGDLVVTQRGAGINLSVDVAAGSCWVLGDTNPVAQPLYRCTNDAVVNLGISPDPSNPRKVIIVAQVTDATFAGATRQWQLIAIHGTPSGSPAEPALPASALKLAVIDVTAADASISNAQITDTRVRASVGGGQAVGGGGGASNVIDLRNPQVAANAGNCFPTVSALTDWEAWHWEFVKDVDGKLYGLAKIGSSLPTKIALEIAAAATSGVTRISVGHKAIGDGESLNPATLTQITAQDITVPGTSRFRKKVTFTITESLAPEDLLLIEVFHEGAHANDTLAVNTELYTAYLE